MLSALFLQILNLVASKSQESGLYKYEHIIIVRVRYACDLWLKTNKSQKKLATN
jgi:hypothetical protein